MAKVDEITKDSWLRSTFPEWGTWLNEEIDEEVVKPKTVALWWTGCMGFWLKTEKNTNIAVDLWFGNGKRTQKNKLMVEGHQMANMSGGRLTQPNRRAQPFVLDPFEVRHLDAVVATHYHADHMDVSFASAVLKNIKEPIPFIGPQASVDLWVKWGVPAERCIVVKPGDSVKVKDVEILALDSFDRTCLVTQDKYEPLAGTIPNMDEKAVNYLFKTSGGNIYDAADSHYSISFADHGKKHQIDVAFGAYGENPVGIADKQTSVDILRMAEALQTKVVIPLHYDIWTNFMADPKEITFLYEMRKYRLQYKFEPFIWEVGGKYVFPDDLGKREYHHRRGFEDAFEHEQNIPFKSLL
ncbi:MAG: L-ascorbate 6-phosphate lactonase [Acholeplasmataceae bacterium]|nr:L-ascorbate 6-phosphate lactonase [Acholeplasmataceae bacterium]